MTLSAFSRNWADKVERNDCGFGEAEADQLLMALADRFTKANIRKHNQERGTLGDTLLPQLDVLSPLIPKMISALEEASGHLYTSQDISHVQRMAREVLQEVRKALAGGNSHGFRR